MACQDSQNVLSIQQGNYQPQSYILREDEKIPLFLIKLWNIVEDPAYYDVIRWDESGYSFHITDPYSFGRNVLPQFFKHNNLNSLIRQLNMYGFRKMTPIERTSLARAESDQDHLEFSHPYFVREHPELLVNIKRKVPNSRQSANNAFYTESLNDVSPPNKDLSVVFEELRQLRERQKNMENKINELVKENEMVWQEMGHMRSTHMKQQQIVNKLVQFLVLLVQSNKQQRLGKRQLLAIDEAQTKRSRDFESNSGTNITSSTRTLNDVFVGNENKGFSGHAPWGSSQQINANEVLDSLISEVASGGIVNLPSVVIPRGSVITARNGPIIADVTDEIDQLNSNNNPAGVTINPNIQQRVKVSRSSQPRIFRNKTTVYNVRPLSLNAKHVSTDSHNYTNVSDVLLPSSQISNQQQSYYGQQPQHNEPSSQSQNPQIHLSCSDEAPSQLHYVSLPAICRGASFPEPPTPSLDQEPAIADQSVQNDFISEQSISSKKISESLISKKFSTEDRPVVINSPSFSGTDLSGTMTQAINEQSRITSPIIDTPQNSVIAPQIIFNDSPRDFGSYLDSIDDSINQCRDNIANHWELNHLIEQFDPNEWPEMLLDDSVPKDMKLLDYNVNSNETIPKRNQDNPTTHSAVKINPLLNMPLNTSLKTPKKMMLGELFGESQ